MSPNTHMSPIARCTDAGVVAILALALSACNEEIRPGDPSNVTVFEASGAVQCESTSGITPQQSSLKLIQQGLDVKRSGCGVTNIIVPTVCGGPTGRIILHDIPSISLDAAERVGFKSVDTLKDRYAWVDCETRRVLP